LGFVGFVFLRRLLNIDSTTACFLSHSVTRRRIIIIRRPFVFPMAAANINIHLESTNRICRPSSAWSSCSDEPELSPASSPPSPTATASLSFESFPSPAILSPRHPSSSSAPSSSPSPAGRSSCDAVGVRHCAVCDATREVVRSRRSASHMFLAPAPLLPTCVSFVYRVACFVGDRLICSRPALSERYRSRPFRRDRCLRRDAQPSGKPSTPCYRTSASNSIGRSTERNTERRAPAACCAPELPHKSQAAAALPLGRGAPARGWIAHSQSGGQTKGSRAQPAAA
jgi:hypothetical protein